MTQLLAALSHVLAVALLAVLGLVLGALIALIFFVAFPITLVQHLLLEDSARIAWARTVELFFPAYVETIGAEVESDVF